jgi:type IV pilus assembly protein PilN
MIRINLLPVREERRKADLRQFAVLLAAVLVGSVAAAAFFHWKITSDIETVKAQVVATKAEIDRFGPQLKQVEKYRETKAQIEKKLEVIERLEASRAGPVHLLDELATHSPDRLWITRVTAQGNRISIQGMSLDNELVASFLTALNSSPWFTDVELRQTEAKEREGFKLNAFELSAAVTSPELEKMNEAKDANPAGRTAANRGGSALGTGR